MRLIIIGMSLFVSLLAMSADSMKINGHGVKLPPLATILNIEGKAKVLSTASIKKHKAVIDETLFQGDKLITYANAKVIIELEDKSKLVLNEGTELTFVDSTKVQQDRGEVYYKIQKRGVSQGLKVETPFSIIGIKGTEFIVNSNDSGEIALNEGLIGVESLSAEFELHKKKVMADYEEFKNKQLQEFETFKAQSQDEIVTYVKAFDLQASKMLRFDDASDCEEDCESRVSELDFTDETQKRFESYQSMIQE